MAISRSQDDHRNLHTIRPATVPGRVLVVDADSASQMIIADVLRDEGFTALLCPSVDQAAEVIRQTQPDAVIVDPWVGREQTAMPVLERVKTDPTLRAIPIIICSADTAFLDDHADTLQRYRCQVIPKPFDVDVLLDAVHAVVIPPQRLVQTHWATLA